MPRGPGASISWGAILAVRVHVARGRGARPSSTDSLLGPLDESAIAGFSVATRSCVGLHVHGHAPTSPCRTGTAACKRARAALAYGERVQTRDHSAMKRRPGQSLEPADGASQPGDALLLREESGAVSFQVRVAPRAAHERVLGVQAGALKVALTAPPVDGAANQALIQFLARRLGVPPRAIVLLRGDHARLKTLRVEGLSPDEVRARLSAH